MSFKVHGLDKTPELVRLPVPKKAGDQITEEGRRFVAVQAGSALEWRERTYRVVVDQNGQPIKPVETSPSKQE